MASPIKDPFANPEQDKTLPPLSPSTSITRPSGTMEEVPEPKNPFADSPRPSTTEELVVPAIMPHPQSVPRMAYQIQTNEVQNGTEARHFIPTMTSGLTARQGEKKPSSSKSATSTEPSSFITGTTLISSTNGDVTMTTNPFADPAPTPAPKPSPRTPLAPQRIYHGQNRLRPSPSPGSSIGPTHPPMSPHHPLGQRFTSIASLASRHLHLVHPLLPSDTKYSLTREALARESARRQDLLLQAERTNLNASIPDLNEPRLRPSPSALRVAAELIRARDSSIAYGSQAVLHSVRFWIGILFLQSGLISTAAAIAVILQAQSTGNPVHVGTGRVFWLVISVVVFVVGGVTAWAIWMRKKGLAFSGGDRGVLRRLGCDEVGLLDRAIVRDLEMGRMTGGYGSNINVERGSTASPRPSLAHQQRPREMPQPGTMSSIVTRDPMWQALYATPQELRQMVSRETLAEDGGTPVRRGGGADTMLGKDGDSLKNFNERSPVKPLEPGGAHLTRSNTSWPLRSTPAPIPSAFVNVHPERLAQAHSAPNTHTQTQQDSSPIPPSSYGNPGTETNSNSKSNTSTPNRRRTESRVEIHSPLSALTHSLNSAELHSMPEHHRPEYIQRRRVASEERVRSLRQSLERPDLSRIHSNTSSIASSMRNVVMPQRVSEDELELAHQHERVGRRRSRSVGEICTVEEFLKTDLNDRGVREKRASSSEVLSREGGGAKGRIGHDVEKAKKVIASVKEHFKEHHGRSLGSVVREKIGKLKDAGVADTATAGGGSKHTSAHTPTSPSREPEVFIIGEESPSK